MGIIIKYIDGGSRDGHVETMTEDDSRRLGVSPDDVPAATNFPSISSGYDRYERCDVKVNPVDGNMLVTMRYVGRTCYRINVNVKVFRALDPGKGFHLPAQVTVYRGSLPTQFQDKNERYCLDKIYFPGGNVVVFPDINPYLDRGNIVRLTDDDGRDWRVGLPNEFTEIADLSEDETITR